MRWQDGDLEAPDWKLAGENAGEDEAGQLEPCAGGETREETGGCRVRQGPHQNLIITDFPLTAPRQRSACPGTRGPRLGNRLKIAFGWSDRYVWLGPNNRGTCSSTVQDLVLSHDACLVSLN
ncbi:hypothetical protein BaRGS_00030996 [Batillaria attramentaria]|uniref:Uncharacterized protein n=1 Tax=Batillaria attramentaria TaxID=370345 RepID=A0ABD0JSI6_9CAEN